MGRGHDGVAVVLGSRTREDPTCEDADKLPGSVLSGSRCTSANPVQSRKEPPVRLLLGLRLQRAPARCAGASRCAALARNVAIPRAREPDWRLPGCSRTTCTTENSMMMRRAGVVLAS